MARKKKQEDQATIEAAKAMANKTPSEREHLIVQWFNNWESAKANLARERLETRTDIERARANLKEAMEQGHSYGDEQAAMQKLHSIEMAWQDVEESKAAAKDRVGAAKDHERSCFEKLQETINSVNQLGLFNESGQKSDIFE